MSTKKSKLKMVLSQLAKLELKAAAVDSYPREAGGLLLGYYVGDILYIIDVFPLEQHDSRKMDEVDVETSEEYASEVFGDWVVGGFHSHVDENFTEGMSTDDKVSCHDAEVVVSIRQGKRKPWLCRCNAYIEYDTNKWKRVKRWVIS